MESSPESWHNFARRLEETGLLGAGELGRVDAHIGRGEPVQCSIACGIEVLKRIGLHETAPSGMTHPSGSLVTRMRRFWVRQDDRRYGGVSVRALHNGLHK